jgi:predicted aldo/keto reductase-like oxidoreductase
MALSRRAFLETAAIAGWAAPAAEVDQKSGMPRRVLGKTGAKVSILAFGCGSRFLMYKEEDAALAAANRAIDLGINYLDTAYGYGNGLSEERIGKVMKTRRKEVWLATKINVRKGDEAMRILEGSMKRLQTDQVDLIHIHSLADGKDLAAIEAPDGVLKVLHKLRDQKVTRFIGVTSHTDPATLKTALERHDFDCTQMALNAALAGMTNSNAGMDMQSQATNSFEALALPVALRKKMGVLAMKTFAQEKLLGKAPIEKLLRYSLSLPVAACVVGMPKLEMIEENVRLAKAFQPLRKEEMQGLSRELSMAHKASLDQFFCRHADA